MGSLGWSIFLNHVGVTCLWESPLRGASYCHAHCLMDPLIASRPLWHHILRFWASEKQPYRWATSLTYWPQLPLTPHCVMLTRPQPHSALPQPRLGQFTPTSCCISDMPIITQSTKENPDLLLNTIRPTMKCILTLSFELFLVALSLERKISFATAH